MREYIPIPNCLTKNGDKLPKKGQNYPKISKMFWDKKIFLEFWAISILCTNLNFPFKLGLTDSPRSTKSWFLFLSWDCLEFFWGQTIYHRKNGHHNQICQWWFFYLRSILSYGQKSTFLFSQPQVNGYSCDPSAKIYHSEVRAPRALTLLGLDNDTSNQLREL